MNKLNEITVKVYECKVEHGLVAVCGAIYGSKQLDKYHDQSLCAKPFADNHKIAVFSGEELICVAHKVWWDCIPSLGVDVNALVDSWCTSKPAITATPDTA